MAFVSASVSFHLPIPIAYAERSELIAELRVQNSADVAVHLQLSIPHVQAWLVCAMQTSDSCEARGPAPLTLQDDATLVRALKVRSMLQ